MVVIHHIPWPASAANRHLDPKNAPSCLGNKGQGEPLIQCRDAYYRYALREKGFKP